MTSEKASITPEVWIDGVLYVPVSQAHVDYDRWMDALVGQWAGDEWREDFPEAPDYLRVIVTDSSDDNELETLQQFIARVIK